jgi:hypothetical protein
MTKFLTLLLLQAVTASGGNPFAFLQPAATITTQERAQLDQGDSIAHVLPANGHEVGVLAAVGVKIDGDRLIAWMRRIELLKKSSYVLAIGRFSNPPRIEDLAGLELDDGDLMAIRVCRPGSCKLKLSADEMATLHQAAEQAAGDWRPAVQAAFLGVVLARVKLYLENGQTPPYADHRSDVSPGSSFNSLLEHSGFLTKNAPQLAEYLKNYPATPAPEIESFVYWSQERPAHKPIISVTHVSMIRGRSPELPDVLVVGKDIYSSHYINGSLSVTSLVRGSGQSNYLVYMNRTELDILHGLFAGIIRKALQGRLRSSSAGILQGLRRRLESGPPQPQKNP